MRLAATATHFGCPRDTARVHDCLHRLAKAHGLGSWRARVRLDARGRTRAEAWALDNPPAEVKLALATAVFEEAGSEFVRFKTTRRWHCDAFAPQTPGVFDTLLWSHQGELTECTPSNLAVQLDGKGVTPAVSCGLLPRTGRAHRPANGRISEAVVRLDDLHRATGLAFMSSQRGWLSAAPV